MSKIDDITNAIIALITLGSAIRCIVLAVNIIMDPDNKEIYIKKMKNTIIVFIFGTVSLSIRFTVEYYFR